MIIVIFDKQTKNCCEKREKAWNVQPIQKTWGAETPHVLDPLWPYASDATCTKNGRWVAALNHYCSQRPLIVDA